MGFAPERDDAVSAGAGLNIDSDLVEEHGDSLKTITTLMLCQIHYICAKAGKQAGKGLDKRQIRDIILIFIALPAGQRTNKKTGTRRSCPAMRIELSIHTIRSDLARRLQELSGQDLMTCYQCGKCSAGCPAAAFMDLLPNQIIRLAQLGMLRAALESETIWYCAACQTCYARCPKGVDLPRVMEALREIALAERGDQLQASEFGMNDLAELPQQAFIAGLRKYTA